MSWIVFQVLEMKNAVGLLLTIRDAREGMSKATTDGQCPRVPTIPITRTHAEGGGMST
jgi:hypothetical protein